MASERFYEQINGKLDALVGRVDDMRLGVTRLEEQVKGNASSVELAEIKGRVASLPTTWQMITLVIGIVGTILGGAFLILKFRLPHAP